MSWLPKLAGFVLATCGAWIANRIMEVNSFLHGLQLPVIPTAILLVLTLVYVYHLIRAKPLIQWEDALKHIRKLEEMVDTLQKQIPQSKRDRAKSLLQFLERSQPFIQNQSAVCSIEEAGMWQEEFYSCDLDDLDRLECQHFRLAIESCKKWATDPIKRPPDMCNQLEITIVEVKRLIGQLT